MFTDIVKSTDVLELVGDEYWENALRWHDEMLQSLFSEYGAEEVKQVGDGFFVAFPDASKGIACAVAIQRALLEHGRSHGFAPRLRIGVHLAEATERGDDYGGRGVHEAARIAAAAVGGEILTTVETLEAADEGWAASDPRVLELKGISEPARVVSVDWSGTGRPSG